MSTINQATVVDITQDPGLNYLSGGAVATVQKRQASGLPTGNVIFNTVTEVRNIYVKQNNPGGDNGQIQIKSGSSFVGDPEFSYNPNTNRLELDGTIVVGSIYADNFFFANNQSLVDVFSQGGSASTGNITFADTTLTSSNGDVKIHFSPSASPAVEFSFTETGSFVFPDGTIQTTAYTGQGGGTGNITFSGDTISSTNNSVNITGSNYTQIECTDNSSYNVQVWTEAAGAYVYKDGTQWAFTTPTVAGSTSNAFEFPNGVKQRSGDFVNCDPNMDTVIYTSSEQYTHTLKLLLNIEGVEDGQSQPDTQSCEMIVAKSFRANTVSGSAYGLVYTSVNPLVTLSTRWNALSNRIEVVCRPTSSMNTVYVHVACTELSSSSI